ncbi:serine/threonine-protein kinase [Arthrobacter sp. EpRS71]|uniref:serine/threonine-protein kinase n=1 Tax=Arthrobacter sp. EpRS71 TaxID=1743141 RepID=UPI00074825BD|nr:serine/threonine-protein kinase [Arthrobacter sp. EpRS71]KUM42083.1 protein kinase [Arthrobacter sp. EpRS71]
MTLLGRAAVRADRGAVCTERGAAAERGAATERGPATERGTTAPRENASEPDVVLGGRYRLGAQLGGGSEAYVNEAWDLETGRAVAVKIFRSTDSTDNAPCRRELDIHGRLRHKNIVRVLNSGRYGDNEAIRDSAGPAAGHSHGSRNYVVMELVGGKDLRWIMQDSPASMEQTAAWMTDVARALAHVHRRGIVHNDIKPGNILVDFDSDPQGLGIAKLADFGIALNGRHSAPNSSSGTPHYLSPEEVCGGTSTPASDIYSLGLVALECLTGTKAFPGPPLESMVARTLGEPRIPGTVRRRWSMVLHAMTDPHPAGRPSAGQAVGMLRRLSW